MVGIEKGGIRWRCKGMGRNGKQWHSCCPENAKKQSNAKACHTNRVAAAVALLQLCLHLRRCPCLPRSPFPVGSGLHHDSRDEAGPDQPG